MRLSDENLAVRAELATRFRDPEMTELIRGYRRAAALEDMLREWMRHAENMYARYQDEPCTDCIEAAERTEALLAEGDESPATFAVRFERGQWAKIDAALADCEREWEWWDQDAGATSVEPRLALWHLREAIHLAEGDE